MGSADWSRFSSPFSWRYGSEAMRQIWSEEYKRRLWRRIWVALAGVQSEAGLVSPEQVEELRVHQNDIDLERAAAIEAEIHHDLMAEIKTYAEQCPAAGGIIHLGATSMDIEDNADILRIREALDLIREGLVEVLNLLARHIEAEADTPVMGYTHIQPAEPTTLGYRLCQCAQDLLTDLQLLDYIYDTIRGKGFKGAVGTSASYQRLLKKSTLSAREMETRVMERLGIPAVPVSTQTYPRKYDYLVLNLLAGIAQSLHKFALDLRLLQSPSWGELREPFGKRQVGSSAMPFKRNPIIAEGLCSLARYVAALPRIAWDNAALSILERTLDDSANRRAALPEAFLATDEILRRARRILANLQINREAMARNLATYGPFAATETLLMELVAKGADRQEMHERIREHCMAAWQAIEHNKPNPLVDLLAGDDRLRQYLPPARIREVMESGTSVGDAPTRCYEFVSNLRSMLESSKNRRAKEMVEFGERLAEGKTKIVYTHPTRDDQLYLVHKDSISAGDGAKRDTLPGKGALSCRTTSNVFKLLESKGIPTHFISMVADDVTLVKRCEMIPLEVVMRRIATGSYLRRHPEVKEGTRFDPILVEFFLKDDTLHDPLISPSEIVEKGIASAEEVEYMTSIGRRVFEVLEEAWASQDIALVDCKIEYGRDSEGNLLVADVIDNDSWRLWPGGDKTRMLDKQIYREMSEVTDEGLARLLSRYEEVAKRTDAWQI